jgi:signal transduction histidine kinase
MRRRFRRPPPHWWPEGEAWPPADPHRQWRRRRTFFLRRLVFAAGSVWLISALSGAAIFGRRGGAGIFIALVMFAAVSAILFRRVAWPIGDVVAAAHRIAGGDFSARIPPLGPPTLRVVANAFNDMAARLEVQEKQRRELMADVAHELRTPLSVVQGRLEGLVDGVYPADAAHLEPLLDETRVLTRLVEDLRTLSNAESGMLTLQREPTDVGMLVRDAVDAIDDEARRLGVTVTVEDDPAPAPVNVDPVRMRQVVVNLLANAVRHGGSGSSVTARVQAVAGGIAIAVADTGPGIPAEEVPRVFDRFRKRAGSTGSGLGLTIARTLARAHGGDIDVDSRPGAGTTMTVRVPV